MLCHLLQIGALGSFVVPECVLVDLRQLGVVRATDDSNVVQRGEGAGPHSSQLGHARRHNLTDTLQTRERVLVQLVDGVLVDVD